MYSSRRYTQCRELLSYVRFTLDLFKLGRLEVLTTRCLFLELVNGFQLKIQVSRGCIQKISKDWLTLLLKFRIFLCTGSSGAAPGVGGTEPSFVACSLVLTLGTGVAAAGDSS